MAGPLDPLVYRTNLMFLGSKNLASTSSRAVWTPQTPGQIVAGWVSDDAGVTVGTNTYSTVALVDGSTTMISINSSTVPITVDVMNPMTLSTTVANTKFAAGDTLFVQMTDTLTGTTFTNMWMQIDWVPGTYN